MIMEMLLLLLNLILIKLHRKGLIGLRYFEFIILYYLYSIQVICDVVKPRKPVPEIRPPPVKAPQQKKLDQSEQNFARVKLGLSDYFKQKFLSISCSTSGTFN
jgi:hypothetical protein